jgi:hypothetical protein
MDAIANNFATNTRVSDVSSLEAEVTVMPFLLYTEAQTSPKPQTIGKMLDDIEAIKSDAMRTLRRELHQYEVEAVTHAIAARSKEEHAYAHEVFMPPFYREFNGSCYDGDAFNVDNMTISEVQNYFAMRVAYWMHVRESRIDGLGWFPRMRAQILEDQRRHIVSGISESIDRTFCVTRDKCIAGFRMRAAELTTSSGI